MQLTGAEQFISKHGQKIRAYLTMTSEA